MMATALASRSEPMSLLSGSISGDSHSPLDPAPLVPSISCSHLVVFLSKSPIEARRLESRTEATRRLAESRIAARRARNSSFDEPRDRMLVKGAAAEPSSVARRIALRNNDDAKCRPLRGACIPDGGPRLHRARCDVYAGTGGTGPLGSSEPTSCRQKEKR